MSSGPSVRVLLFHPERPASRDAIDWIAEHQAYSRVLVPPTLRAAGELPARANHEPFATPTQEDARLAIELSSLLVPAAGPPRVVAEGTVLALLASGALIATDTRMFRDFIPLSCWSMNLPERPTDGLLAQHLGVAGRLPATWGEVTEEAMEALLSGDSARLAPLARARRLRARRDGPERFGRLAKRSAGLRPGIVYLDLLASPGASGPEFAEFLRALDRPRALLLLSVAAALFI